MWLCMQSFGILEREFFLKKYHVSNQEVKTNCVQKSFIQQRTTFQAATHSWKFFGFSLLNCCFSSETLLALGCFSPFSSLQLRKFISFTFRGREFDTMIYPAMVQKEISPGNTFSWSPTTPCNLSIALDNISFHQFPMDIKAYNLWTPSSFRKQ